MFQIFFQIKLTFVCWSVEDLVGIIALLVREHQRGVNEDIGKAVGYVGGSESQLTLFQCPIHSRVSSSFQLK